MIENSVLKNLKIEEPNKKWKEIIESLENSNLIDQKTIAIFKMRCEQAEVLGFTTFDADKKVEELTGEKYTDFKQSSNKSDSHEFDYVYDHHTDSLKESIWTITPTFRYKIEKKNAWFLPPFKKIEKWCYQIGTLKNIKRLLPYDMLIKLDEIKKLKLFNAFLVLSNKNTFSKNTNDPVVLIGCIWELPITKEDGKINSGLTKNYYICEGK